ncbi:hypothetical protein PENSTE_c026G03717 [Penicillium steckii]|uniref:Major facilitator superfamily (MFS) profile domain-containing protein n=1 Tax=Penicillium steckii TaxID=303698 RepID=A0A1V6SQ83_9EURO|nr:hypothetical protein PENSTE_c026G03717 [Penicillium steckii]
MPLGYKWRSSKWFVLATISIALFAETFLYGFLVPFLGEMLRFRIHIPPSKIQELTSSVLAMHGALAMIAGPIIGHFSDQTPHRRTPLIISLAVCIAGTVLVAAARSVAILLLGRAMQSIAGSAVWIIGFATVADTVSQSNMGSAMGLVMSFANSGTISGPAISGVLYEAFNYWVLWSIPLLVLIIDLVARALMLESRSETSSGAARSDESDVSRPLLPQGDQEARSGTGGLWLSLLWNGRVLTCLLVTLSSLTVSTSLYATLPSHIEENFQWGPKQAGLLFAGLAVPGILIGPFAGWVRDKIGARYPALVGSILQALCLGMSGIAGTDAFPWSNAQSGGKAMYSVSLVAIGILRPFVSGIAPAELTTAAKSIQEKAPITSNARGGVSRVIAMMDVAASLGMMIGPIVGGALKALLGYKYMSFVWSE